MTFFPKYIFIDDSSIQFSIVDNVYRSEMESGLQKVKPRESVPMFNISFDVSINKNDITSFYNWYLKDLRSGANWFLLKHPLTGKLSRFRFLNNEISWDKIGTLVISNFELEGYYIDE